MSSTKTTCTIKASITTGLESTAVKEIEETLNANNVKHGRGFVTWQQSSDSVHPVSNLRIAENLEVVMSTFKVDFIKDTGQSLSQLCELLKSVDWHTGIEVWRQYTGYEHPVSAEFLTQPPQADNSNDSKQMPSFRATCYRTGQNHQFSSQEVAHKVGGQISDLFGWRVDLKNFDIEVVIAIVDDEVEYSLALTKKSLSRRNITHFSRTTLKATICAGLLRLADIKPGDVVVDPMCGSGGITIEGALQYPSSMHVAGDNQEFCVNCARSNILEINDTHKLEKRPALNAGVIWWDATNLPLKTASVDVIVSDLPFGKRMGNKIENKVLYPQFLTEAARIVSPGTGRAVLLTTDKKCMTRVLPSVKDWWVVPRTTFINHGGLRACIYVLRRTSKFW